MNSHFPMVFFPISWQNVPRQVDTASAQAADAIIALGQAGRVAAIFDG